MNRFINLIILTFIFIVSIKFLLPDPKTNKEQLDSFWSNKTHASNSFDILACGDSRIYRGVSSDVINPNRKNLAFLNLGYSSAGLSDDYLKFVLSKFKPRSKNKILIVGITPHSLTFEAFKNEGLKSQEKINYFNQFRFKYFSFLLKYVVPFKFSEILKFKKVNYVQRYESDGWVASTKIEQDSTFALNSYKKTFNKYGVHHKEMVSFLESINRIANSGIHVIAFRPPSTLQMEILEDSISGFDENFIKENLDSSVIWMDFNNADFISYDGSHLTEKSAIKFSKKIMQEIEIIYKKSAILDQHPNSSSQ